MGAHENIPVERFNAAYTFARVVNHMDEARGSIQDTSKLVLILDIKCLVYWYCSFTVVELRCLCDHHRITFRNMSKTEIIHALMTHTCDIRCQNLIYIFKGLTTRRRNVLQHFLPTEAPDPNHQHVEEPLGVPHNNPVLDEDSYDHLAPLDLDTKMTTIKEWQETMSTERLKLVVCAVCGRHITISLSSWVEGYEIQFSLLRNDSLPNEVLPKNYDIDIYEGAILNVKGLEFTHQVVHLRLCNECKDALDDDQMPKFALSNWLYYGIDSLPDDVGMAFRQATVFDRMMICRARCNSVVCRFNSGEHPEGDAVSRARKGIRGNVIVAPLDAIQMNNVIPPPPEVIYDTMCAVFVGSTPTTANITKYSPILVRKSRVKVMIEFLLNKNPHYMASDTFSYSSSNLQCLLNSTVDQGVPAAVRIGNIPANNAIESSTSDYTLRNMDSQIHEPSAMPEILMENVGYTEGDESPLSYKKMKAISLERCLTGKPVVIVRPGSQYVPDIQNPSILTWLFLHLDPWGIGGFHDPRRKVKLTMKEHVAYLLSVDDSPFERDPEFAFVFYNVIRKAMVSNTLRFTVPYKTHASLFSEVLTVDPEVLADLNTKCYKDPAYRPINEEERKAFRLLSSIKMVARHVPGSDGYKVMLRNQIRAIIYLMGTPSLFITLNPADVDHPLVRLLSGEDIDLEDITRGEDMDEWKRKLHAAKNPAACALFFDLMMRSFIKIVLRYGRSERGVFGRCKAYFGTVEAQGKGTLHCHMLIWLEGHVSPLALQNHMLDSKEYKNRVFKWLESLIKCEFPGDASVSQSSAAHPSRLRYREQGNPHPGTIPAPLISLYEGNMVNYWKEYDLFLEQLVHQYYWHEHQATCWKYLKRGQEKNDQNCRMGMDGMTREVTCIDDRHGGILLRRHHPKVSPLTDVVAFVMQCNTNSQFIGSAEAANAFIWYVTGYMTKFSLPVHVGMAALSYVVKKTHESVVKPSAGDKKQAIGAVTTAVNSMMARQEISQPQVMSYLLGGGDHYTSEEFSSMNWGAIRRQAKKEWERLNSTEDTAQGSNANLTIDDEGITISNQHLDYTFRSDAAEWRQLCLYNFAAFVYKIKLTKREKETGLASGQFSGDGHPQFLTHRLRMRKTMKTPVLLGSAFPNPNKSPELKEEWAGDMLLLFKPWRSPLDLKEHGQTWTDAYNVYESQFDEGTKKIIQNMTVLSECSEARERWTARGPRQQPGGGQENESPAMNEFIPYDDLPEVFLNEALNAVHVADPGSGGEADEGTKSTQGMNLLARLGPETMRLFDMCLPDAAVGLENESPLNNGREVMISDGTLLGTYSRFMDAKRKRGGVAGTLELDDPNPRPLNRARGNSPSVELAAIPEFVANTRYQTYGIQVAESIANDMGLNGNAEQVKAFMIVARQAIFRPERQLLMHVAGVGGTGKSHVIKAIVTLFERLKRRAELLIGAPTGIATVLIGGQTLHSLIFAGPNSKTANHEGLSSVWRDTQFLIVDEVSMVGAAFLSELSIRIRQGKGHDPQNRGKPFGGVNVIFMGDFGQLDPPRQASLYCYRLVKSPSFTESRDTSAILAMNGAFLWRQVDVVVHLKKNQRQSADPLYAEFLSRLRTGKCTHKRAPGEKDDLDYIQSRILSNLEGRGLYREMQVFCDAAVIVGSRVLRDAINARLIEYHAKRNNRQVFNYYSKDTFHKHRIPPAAQRLLWDIPSTKHHDSFGCLPIFIGMKVAVTENLAFDSRIVNGSEGVVVDIKYEEEDGRRYAVVAFVYVEGCGISVPNLELSYSLSTEDRARLLPDIVPIFTSGSSIKCDHINHPDLGGSFNRRQLPLVPAYAFTDYKSQGRTFDRVIVDLDSARRQGVYVMLSRVKSLAGLAILRWFPESKIYSQLSEELRDELKRLEVLEMEANRLS